MSCFGKKGTKEQEVVSKEIDKQIKHDKKKILIRLLLLGTGDSGKSTFAKQMNLAHKGAFSKEKLAATVPILHANCLDSMKLLLSATEEWSIKIPKKLRSDVEAVRAADELTPAVAESIADLWASQPIKKAFEQRSKLQLPGGASTTEYYFENVQRFAEEAFVPNDDDMIRAKHKTTGVSETNFSVKGVDFVMVDVGGQRSERKKWLQCFTDVSCVIYLVALNEYDMLMEEDERTNRMEESLKLFQKLSASQWLVEIPFILFLNKSDLFEEKIKTQPLSEFFEDYDDFVDSLEDDSLSDFERGCEYIKVQYQNNFAGCRMYNFITCALDNENCVKVFDAARDNIINRSFVYSGL